MMYTHLMPSMIRAEFPMKSSAHWLSEQVASVTRCAMIIESLMLCLFQMSREELSKLELVEVVLGDREDNTDDNAKQIHTALHMEQRYDSWLVYLQKDKLPQADK